MSAEHWPELSRETCDDDCDHIVCAHNRRLAALLCAECERPIGTRSGFFGAIDGDVGDGDLTHAECWGGR
jgi:hypothetical protein